MKAAFLNFGLPIIIALFGLGFLCLGGGKLYLNQLYKQEGKEAIGTVTRYTSHTTPSPVSSSNTEYKFRTPDGEEIIGHQNGYYSQVGERVTIEYLPDSPKWNRFSGAAHLNENWNIPMAIGGLLFFVAGFYALIRATFRR